MNEFFNTLGQLGLGKFPEDINVPTLVPGEEKFRSISAGGDFTLAITNEDKLFVFGANEYSQLGLGDNVNRFSPTLLEFTDNVLMVSAGGVHSVVLLSNGSVWTFGNNGKGRLGHGDNNRRKIPTRVSIVRNVKMVAAGSYHTLLLDSNGTVWSCGDNEFGQLGLGHVVEKWSFEQVPGLSEIVYITCGGDSSYARDKDGNVFVFGKNNFGQLANDQTENLLSPCQNDRLSNKPFLVGGSFVITVNEAGNALCFGSVNKTSLVVEPGIQVGTLIVPHFPQTHHRNLYDLSWFEKARAQLCKGLSSNILEADLSLWPKLEDGVLPFEDQKEQLVHGSVSWIGWKKCSSEITSSLQEFESDIDSNQTRLSELETSIKELETKLQTLKQQADQVKTNLDIKGLELSKFQILNKWFDSMSNCKRLLKKQFLAKIRASDFQLSQLTEEDLLIFLNLADVPELIPWFLSERINGPILDIITEAQLKDLNVPLGTRLKFFAGLDSLQSGFHTDRTHLLDCPVCKCQTPEDQHLFWKEWNLQFTPTLGLTPQLMTRFKKEHLASLGLSISQQAKIWQTILDIKQVHNDF
jgi:hypothetical protein